MAITVTKTTPLNLPPPLEKYDRRNEAETRKMLERVLAQLGVDQNLVPIIYIDASAAPYNGVADGVSSTTSAINAAIVAANALGGATVWLPSGTGAWGISAPLVALDKVRLLAQDGVIVSALAGYSANYMVEQRGACCLEDLTFDGTHLPHQTSAWLGVAQPTGSVLWADGTTVPVKRPRNKNVRFQNIPNGCVFYRKVDEPLFEDCYAFATQTDTTYAQSACFEFFQCNDGRLWDCVANDYRHKAYNIGDSNRFIGTSCHAYGGTNQNPGHAAFYEDGSTDCKYVSCYHEGPGFSYKAHLGVRTVLEDFTCVGSFSGPYFQSCSDFRWIGGNVQPSVAYGGIVENIVALGGPGRKGLIEGVTIRKLYAGVSTNDTGIVFQSDVGLPVQDITIKDVTIENCLFGVWLKPVAGGAYTNIVIDNLQTIGTTQYSVIGYVESIRIINSLLGGTGTGPGIFLESEPGTPGTRIELRNIHSVGHTGTVYQIGAGGSVQFDTVILDNLTADTPNLLWDVKFPGVSDYINHLTITDCRSRNQPGATGASVTFNPITLTTGQIVGNSLRSFTNLPVNIALTNGNSWVGGNMYGNDINAITGMPTLGISGADLLTPVYNATAVYTAGVIGIGAETYQNIFLPGGVVGDFTIATLNPAPAQAIKITSQCIAGNVVLVIFRNDGAFAVPYVGNVNVRLFPQ